MSNSDVITEPRIEVRSNSNSASCDAGSFVYIQDAQLETGDVATDYIETTTSAVSVGPLANIPRLDYSGGANSPSLLLEPQRTNLALYSEQFDNAAWSKSADGTMTANQAVSPDGYQNADRWLPSAVTGFVGFENTSAYSVTIGNTYTSSIFAKANGYRYVQLFFDGGDVSDNPIANFDLQTGTVTREDSGLTASIVDYGNGWYRLIGTYVAASGAFQHGFAIVTDSNASRAQSTTYNGTDSVLFYGCQMELGAYATSYIPTLSATVTRGADLALRTGASAIIGQTEGTIFWEIQVDTPVAAGNEDLLNIDDGAFGDTIYISKGALGTLGGEMYVSNVVQASFTKTGITAGVHKIAFAYATNNTAFFLDGVQVGTTDTSCSVPAMNRIQLGNGILGPSTSKTKQVLLFPTRLSNADLATLTTL